jgi:hypothetical protein
MAINLTKGMWRVTHVYCLQPQYVNDAILKLRRANKNIVFVVAISDFRLEVDEKCSFLGYYAARKGNLLLAFPIFRIQKSKIS